MVTREKRLDWGTQDKAFDAIRGTTGWLVEAMFLSAGLILWCVLMALAGVFTLLVVLVWLHGFLWSKISPKDKSRRRRNSLKVMSSH